MNDSNQYMVQVSNDYDQNTYIIHDANGLPVQYEGGTIIQGDLSDGNNLMNDQRWIQQSGGRGGKLLNSQNFLNGDMVGVNGTGLNLNTRFTPSSMVANPSNAGTQFDQDNLRIASAVSGAGGRGRPRGRKPSRGNFPVVPIDMVRQLGIEQQVILQPTVPVAMKNKSTLCKPLQMSKKTQCSDTMGMTGSIGTETTIKRIYTPVFIPVPVPVYIPVPTFIRIKAPKTEVNDTPQLKLTTPLYEEVTEEVYKDTDTVPPANILNKEIIKDTETTTTTTTQNNDVVSMNVANEVESNNVISNNKRRINTEPDNNVAKHRKIDSTSEKKDFSGFKLKYTFGINAFRHWSKGADLLNLEVPEINKQLMEFVEKVRKPNNNEVYAPDSILYLCLGIQLFIYENKYELNMFTDPRMNGFQRELNKVMATFKPKLSENQVLVCRIEEEHLWEAHQFGTFSPKVLIFTVCYILTKQMKYKTAEQHSVLKMKQLKVTDSSIVFITSEENTEDGSVTEKEHVLCVPCGDSRRCFYTIVKEYVEKVGSFAADGCGGALYLSAREGVPKVEEWFVDEAMCGEELVMMLNRIMTAKEVQESLLSGVV